MSYELEGTLHKKFDTESKTDTFQARDFVVEISNGNYPQLVKLQLVQDRCSLLDPFEEGHPIKVHFDLRGREWKGKYFTNLNAWRLEQPAQASGAETQNAESGGDGGGYFPGASDEPATPEGDDDLPF